MFALPLVAPVIVIRIVIGLPIGVVRLVKRLLPTADWQPELPSWRQGFLEGAAETAPRPHAAAA